VTESIKIEFQIYMLNIVGTPIGNLDDLSLRAAKTIASSDIILAEDTRSAHILLNFIKSSFMLRVTCSMIWSYYKDVEFQKLPEILELLKDGKNITLISESGMPLISDPGFLLVKNCIKNNISITVIPGPTAVTTALIYSGFEPENFMFLGFLPKGESKVNQCINTLIQTKKLFKKIVFVFYESPKRINNTLEILSRLLPESEVCICRELTKKFEEISRGHPAQLLTRTYRGEITILLTL